MTNPNASELVWIHACDGALPSGALEGGKQSNGETLYIGRAVHERSLIVGKVHPSHGVLYIPFAGKELAVNQYEVLCAKAIHM